MGTIGDTLREARMRQQIDIAEVEEATKIRAKYLRALENEEFSLLPDAPRVRSFLRTYAEWLGLDARMLVEEYRARARERGERPEPATGLFGAGVKVGRSGARPRRGALIIVAVVALVAFLAILGLANDDDGGGGGSKKQGGESAQRERQRTPARASGSANESARRQRSAPRRLRGGELRSASHPRTTVAAPTCASTTAATRSSSRAP